MDLPHYLGPSNAEKVVIPLEKLSMGLELGVSKVPLFEVIALNHRPHSPIEDQVTLSKNLCYLLKSTGSSHARKPTMHDRTVQRIERLSLRFSGYFLATRRTALFK